MTDRGRAWGAKTTSRRRSAAASMLAATSMLAAASMLAGCAKPEPPARIAFVPEAPCVEYAYGRCSARLPRVAPKPAAYEKLLPPYDGLGWPSF